MKNITAAIPRASHHLEVHFDNGQRFHVDMRPFIKNGVSAALRDEAYFRAVKVEDGYIYWENGFDFCPEALFEYAEKEGVRIEDDRYTYSWTE